MMVKTLLLVLPFLFAVSADFSNDCMACLGKEGEGCGYEPDKSIACKDYKKVKECLDGKCKACADEADQQEAAKLCLERVKSQGGEECEALDCGDAGGFSQKCQTCANKVDCGIDSVSCKDFNQVVSCTLKKCSDCDNDKDKNAAEAICSDMKKQGGDGCDDLKCSGGGTGGDGAGGLTAFSSLVFGLFAIVARF